MAISISLQDFHSSVVLSFPTVHLFQGKWGAPKQLKSCFRAPHFPFAFWSPCECCHAVAVFIFPKHVTNQNHGQIQVWADLARPLPPFDSQIMRIQPILGLNQPISTLGPLFLKILDPTLYFLCLYFTSSLLVILSYLPNSPAPH